VLIWVLPFETMERTCGLLGLTMLVFVVAVWHLDPDWSRLWCSATTPAPPPTESWPAYLFFLVTLIGAQMTPYEMFFFSPGAVESRWRPKT
jgi:manganese transport protein